MARFLEHSSLVIHKIHCHHEQKDVKLAYGKTSDTCSHAAAAENAENAGNAHAADAGTYDALHAMYAYV
ncbi:hypothetical protein [Thermoactinomyces mirandus]|uniref:hypothetical protein n=1 Tax=Thermoactinomyces mirandus TaxID=2756294 RepID=UPI0015EF29F9|nr:hypothetical protein [Thermoactinomyces mirandus]